jgi:hypothetical protein
VKLIHELEVHQIELECKWRTFVGNRAKKATEKIMHYMIFCHLATLVSLKKKCDCSKLARFRNVTQERFKLINSRLGFLFGWDKTSFQSFFRKHLKIRLKKCEVVLHAKTLISAMC